METVKDRLTAYLKEKGMSKSEFGRRIGVSRAYIQSMAKTIGPDTLQKISMEFPELDITWLLTGSRSAPDAVPSYFAAEPFTAGHEKGSQSEGVPFFDIEAASCGALSGFGEAFTSNNIAGRIVIPNMTYKEGDIFIKTQGRSMIDTVHPELSIPEGAMVLVRPWRANYIQWGEIYCIMTADGYAVKRLKPGADDDHISCVSADDDNYPAYELLRSDIVGIGRVLAILSYRTI